MLALAAASLLYVAVADLIPSLHRHPSPGDTARQLALIGVGIAIIAVAHVRSSIEATTMTCGGLCWCDRDASALAGTESVPAARVRGA